MIADDTVHPLGGEVFPIPRSCPFQIPDGYTTRQQNQPVSRVSVLNGGQAWLLTRYADVRFALSDPRFSADRRRDGFPHPGTGNSKVFASRNPSMITLDGEEHTTARRRIIPEFSMKRVTELHPRIQRIVDRCIDDLLTSPPPVNLVTALSLPVSSMVICELLGVPYADHKHFQMLSSRLLQRDTTDQKDDILGELVAYLAGLVRAKEVTPGDDILSRQIARQRDESGEVNHADVVSMAFLLLVAGYETTANMISLGVYGLLTHPDRSRGATQDREDYSLVVEELLRYFSIIDFGPARVATEDVVVGDTLIRSGEGVIAATVAANRDALVFDDPDSMNLGRGARNHVAFGYGPHQCIGHNLARKELELVYRTLFTRIPDLRLDTDSKAVFKSDSFQYGMYDLPVTWTNDRDPGEEMSHQNSDSQ